MSHSMLRRLVLGVSVVAVFACSAAQGQSYPARPVRLLVPSTPGGSVDTLSRAVAARLFREVGTADGRR